MTLLLVVGLAAVILVILIAVFLSLRLGRGDDHEESEGRPGERSRDRLDAEDSRSRDRDRREARRPSAVSARSARAGVPNGQRQRAEAEPDRRYRDRDERRPEREQARPREYDYPPQRGGRYDSGPLEHPSDPRRPVAAGARRAGSSRDQSARRSGSGRDRYDSGASLSDTGPAPRPAADDFPSGPFPAADLPSGEFPSGPLPVADFPSGEMPAARGRGRSAAAGDGGRDRPEQRRKPAKGQSAAKGRSRSKRDDDDDWPSMEWDKLSDEQYWAELSSDKPLASSEPKPAAAKNGQSRASAAKTKSAKADPAPALPPAAEPVQGRDRDLPSRKGRSAQQREAVTERLPIRARPQPAAPARTASDSPPPARAGNGRQASEPSEPSLAMLASLASAPPPARPAGALDEDPLTSPSFARPTVDSRSYQSARKNPQAQDTGGHQQLDSPPASAGYGGNGYGTGGYEAAGYNGNGYANGSGHSAGRGHSAAEPAAYVPASGTYQAPDYNTTTAYAYPPAPAAQPSLPPAPAPQQAGWYDEPAVPQGNPYGSYVEPAQASYPTTPPAGYEHQQHAGAGYPGYPAGYAEQPGYDQAAAMPYQAMPGAGVPVPPAGDTQLPPPGSYPEAGYAEAGGYPQEHSQGSYDAYGNDGYAPGYPAGYAADPYGHDGYGGYPASQG
ncbi:MAG TPA: hypothetical protein VMV17_18210 [Streptosporangiaceae bacterium]|nr:hypothetical protein [Streptosporangiaceae bacterium]